MPGRKFSISTSASSTSRSIASRPLGLLRSSTTQRLPRPSSFHVYESPPSGGNQPMRRTPSPPGASTFTTDAPKSARWRAVPGPAKTVAMSTTRTPSRASIGARIMAHDLAHAGRVGAPRALRDGVADPRRRCGAASSRRPSGTTRRSRYEIATTEPVLMVAPPGAGAEAAARCATPRRRGRRVADRRLVDARHGRDRRRRRRPTGRRRLRLQLVGREVPPLRRGRTVRRADVRRARPRTHRRRAVRARRRRDHRRRRRNARHDRAVPAEPEPQPDDDARRRSRPSCGPGSVSRRSCGCRTASSKTTTPTATSTTSPRSSRPAG